MNENLGGTERPGTERPGTAADF